MRLSPRQLVHQPGIQGPVQSHPLPDSLRQGWQLPHSPLQPDVDHGWPDPDTAGHPEALNPCQTVQDASPLSEEPHLPGVVGLFTEFGGSPVLPGDDVVELLARDLVPGGEGGPLAGDTNAGDVVAGEVGIWSESESDQQSFMPLWRRAVFPVRCFQFGGKELRGKCWMIRRWH